MYTDDGIGAGRTPGSACRRWIVGMLIASAISSCAGTADRTTDFSDGTCDLLALVRRFAPRLYLHEDEPYGLEAVVPVLHPSKPIIAYHIFFESEFIREKSGESDHEIVWVEFDPVTLKVTDVAAYWHRTVLRTRECVLDARNFDQRPHVDVQWGQHGMLPFGWRRLRTARPRAELVLYYSIVHRTGDGDDATRRGRGFRGSYDDYLRFGVLIDAARYIEDGEVIVTERPAEALRARVAGRFADKKEWPDR